MADYGPNEIVDMIMILGESRNNYAAAARLYAERYPNRRHPNKAFNLSNVTLLNYTEGLRTFSS
ncbi:hypothetical protein TSAR_002063 [Trichomalopsis sarcophagae]|uniref:DUF4817 domain-containing protein n=1 Tax=Trichomalopsis sarcophagae TaxID=543379 RepID=A0A232EJ48_9HYME|nr:hypothetical protein TSAR_002063 [Trichomalopsis sarcophagae]